MFNHQLLSAQEIAEILGLPLRSCYRLPLPWVKLNKRTKRCRLLDLWYYVKNQTSQKS